MLLEAKEKISRVRRLFGLVYNIFLACVCCDTYVGLPVLGPYRLMYPKPKIEQKVTTRLYWITVRLITLFKFNLKRLHMSQVNVGLILEL